MYGLGIYWSGDGALSKSRAGYGGEFRYYHWVVAEQIMPTAREIERVVKSFHHF